MFMPSLLDKGLLGSPSRLLDSLLGKIQQIQQRRHIDGKRHTDSTWKVQIQIKTMRIYLIPVRMAYSKKVN